MTFWSDHRGIIYGVRTIRVYKLIQDLPYSTFDHFLQVNEAEKDRLDSEGEHLKMTTNFKVAQDVVQKLQQELKRSINKSK